MNKLETLHLDAITQADFDPEDKAPNYVGFASKSSEVTEQIAIEFAEWCAKNAQFYNNDNWFSNFNDCKTKDLFQEFLKTKQLDKTK